jgi:hypothetical protein
MVHSPSCNKEQWRGRVLLAEKMVAVHRSLSSIQSSEEAP